MSKLEHAIDTVIWWISLKLYALDKNNKKNCLSVLVQAIISYSRSYLLRSSSILHISANHHDATKNCAQKQAACVGKRVQ